jgi:hypothetical protein
MPLQETIDTFGYFVSELDKLDLAYVVFARYLTLFDPQYDGTTVSLPSISSSQLILALS